MSSPSFPEPTPPAQQRRYQHPSEYGFWKLTLISTLVTVFLPWSLVFCIVTMGWDDAITLFRELILDMYRTLKALAVGLLILITALIAGIIGYFI